MEQLINTDYNKTLTEKLIENDKNDIEKQQKEKYQVIENKISDIKEQMVDNIEEAINRKHNIDVIIDNTYDLEGHSLKFNNGAIKLKKKQCWSMWRCRIYIIIILLFTIFLVVLISCKFNLKKC